VALLVDLAHWASTSVVTFAGFLNGGIDHPAFPLDLPHQLLFAGEELQVLRRKNLPASRPVTEDLSRGFRLAVPSRGSSQFVGLLPRHF
jgi:hypothetical protein